MSALSCGEAFKHSGLLLYVNSWTLWVGVWAG